MALQICSTQGEHLVTLTFVQNPLSSFDIASLWDCYYLESLDLSNNHLSSVVDTSDGSLNEEHKLEKIHLQGNHLKTFGIGGNKQNRIQQKNRKQSFFFSQQKICPDMRPSLGGLFSRTTHCCTFHPD